jgi:hypothetical protein
MCAIIAEGDVGTQEMLALPMDYQNCTTTSIRITSINRLQAYDAMARILANSAEMPP